MLRGTPPLPDTSGHYAALYRPIHMIGLELGVSVASAALRKEPTGAPVCFNSDVAATAKRALMTGEMLDGEGGLLVWGKQTPAEVSLAQGYLPLGLAPRPGEWRKTEPRRRRGPTVALGGRGLRCHRPSRQRAPRDGSGLRPARPATMTGSRHLCLVSEENNKVRPLLPNPLTRSGAAGVRESLHWPHVYLSYLTNAAGWRATRSRSRRASSTIGVGPAMKLTVPSYRPALSRLLTSVPMAVARRMLGKCGCTWLGAGSWDSTSVTLSLLPAAAMWSASSRR